MLNFLYGSSNVYRHYKSGLEQGLFATQPLKLVKCTKKTVCNATSPPSPATMVTSVLGNFIIDVCEGVPDVRCELGEPNRLTLPSFHCCLLFCQRCLRRMECILPRWLEISSFGILMLGSWANFTCQLPRGGQI